MGRKGLDAGSQVCAKLRLTRDQIDEINIAVQRLIPPIPTWFNGKMLPGRNSVSYVRDIFLQTEVADEEGVLRRTRRKTDISIHECYCDETGWLYEMGIPVVETGDKWHVNVMQKVPLNMERDNVPPAFLKAVRVAVLNEMFGYIEEDEATDSWVQEAFGDKRCAPEAVEHTLDLRFGKKRVAFDPSDPEANKLAMRNGFAVVHGGSMSSGQWNNAKSGDFIKPAGQVTPSPKPFSKNGDPIKTKPETEWTREMREVVDHCEWVAHKILDLNITVYIANSFGVSWGACYGDGVLYLNLCRLGKRWFRLDDEDDKERIETLLIHEFGHEAVRDHLSQEWSEEVCRLGAKLARVYRTGK